MATNFIDKVRLTPDELAAVRVNSRATAEAATAKALQEFAKADIDTCPCKRCVMIRSVIDSDTPNTAGIER